MYVLKYKSIVSFDTFDTYNAYDNYSVTTEEQRRHKQGPG